MTTPAVRYRVARNDYASPRMYADLRALAADAGHEGHIGGIVPGLDIDRWQCWTCGVNVVEIQVEAGRSGQSEVAADTDQTPNPSVDAPLI